MSRVFLKMPPDFLLEDYVPGRKRPRRDKTIAFNVTPSVKESLERLAWDNHTTVGHLTRCLVEHALADLTKGAKNV